jgi:hypothetical protein
MFRIVLGLFLSIAGGYACAAEAPMRQGDEVLAYDPQAVIEISAEARGLRLIAHRWDLATPFNIAVFTPSGVATCKGGAGLMQVLGSLHSLHLGRIMSDAETRGLQENARAVRLRFVLAEDIDLAEWTFYFPISGGHIALQSEHMDHAAETSLRLEPFKVLEGGCRTLGLVPSSPAGR